MSSDFYVTVTTSISTMRMNSTRPTSKRVHWGARSKTFIARRFLFWSTITSPSPQFESYGYVCTVPVIWLYVNAVESLDSFDFPTNGVPEIEYSCYLRTRRCQIMESNPKNVCLHPCPNRMYSPTNTPISQLERHFHVQHHASVVQWVAHCSGEARGKRMNFNKLENLLQLYDKWTFEVANTGTLNLCHSNFSAEGRKFRSTLFRLFVAVLLL